MTDARDGSSRTIRQFHFTAWPEETEVPRQADYFIDLIGQVWYLLRFYIEDLLDRNLVLFCYIKLYKLDVPIFDILILELGSIDVMN